MNNKQRGHGFLCKRQIRQGPLSDVAMFPAQPFIKSVGDFKSELFI
jgi:hypothetical protein